MNKAKISEIFFSIQGEGLYTGSAQVFIRFFGCDIRCRYCDTKFSRFEEYDAKCLATAAGELAQRYNAGYISLTGGEPLLQADFIAEFLKKHKFKKQRIYLETNGILYKDFSRLKGLIDIVSMDVKLPSAGGVRPYWLEHEKFLRLARQHDVFVKAVVTVSTLFDDMKKTVSLLRKAGRNIPLVLQPEHRALSEKLMKKIIKFQVYAAGYLPDVRVIPQMHRIMGVR